MAADSSVSLLQTSTRSLPLVRFEAGSAVMAEGQLGPRNIVFAVVLSDAPPATVRVSLATSNGSATAGDDYMPRSASLTFLAGETRKTFGIQVAGDIQAEADETFYVDLLSVAGPAVLAQGGSSAIGIILDDDSQATPMIRFATDATALAEGSDGVRNLVFTVTLSAPAAAQIRVAFATTNGSAQAGSDYAARSGQLLFQPGQIQASFGVQVFGDTAFEADERFYADLLSVIGPGRVDASRATAIGVIVNDDTTFLPSVRVGSSTVGQPEGASGPRNVAFAIVLSAPALDIIRVSVATADGSARAGSDYLERAGMVVFQPGEMRKVFGVQVLGDTLFEPDETFYLDMLAVQGPALLDASYTTTSAVITNDDAPMAAAVMNDFVW